MIEKLRLFLTILEEGSLRRAAERCHIAQSAITRQIQLLEQDLGGRVLERASAHRYMESNEQIGKIAVSV